jgi:hypothetical protein
MEYLWDLYSMQITIEMAGGKLIYLLMAGAKQLVTLGLSWSRPGPYVQQWCARGIVLRCTVVLAEGSYKQGGGGGKASRSLRFD